MAIDLNPVSVTREYNGGRLTEFVSVVPSGYVALFDELKRLPRAMKADVAAAVRDAARDVRDEAKAMLAQTRARSRRRRLAPGVRLLLVTGRNEPSQPGRPPAQQTGELRRSIRAVRKRRDGLSYKVEAEFYARFLELGADGKGRRRLEPRPFLTAALRARATQVEARIVVAVDQLLANLAANR
jgi:hypothetical protein